MKSESELIEIPEFDMEPIVFLEGGRGIGDTEMVISDICHDKNITYYILDDLYSDPEKIMAVKYLKPKSIIMGTTGVYKDKIEKVIKVFLEAKHLPEKVFFTMGEDVGVIIDLIEKVKAIKPDLQLFRIYPCSRMSKFKSVHCCKI